MMPTANRIRNVVRRWGPALGLALLLTGIAGGALAAELVNDEVYRLAADHTVTDDLYVSAREVFIDGTVDGDLVVVAGYVEINGVVTGDVLAAAGNVIVNGVVGDDARLAGAGIVITGNIADDLLAAGGGSGFAQLGGLMAGGRAVVPGVRVLAGASVTHDAFLAGETGLVDGAIGRNLFAGFATFQLGGRVDGNATLYARSLTITDDATVGGTLEYSTPDPAQIGEGTATTAVARPWDERDAEPDATPVIATLWWIVRTAMVVLGLALVGWLLLRFFPHAVAKPAAVLRERPFESGLWGAVIVALYLPLAAGLIFLASLFWGFFPGGLATLAFLGGLFSLLWLVSPLLIGYWIGALAGDRLGLHWSRLTTTLVATALLVTGGRLLALVPCVGGVALRLVYLLALALALGSVLLVQRHNVDGTPA